MKKLVLVALWTFGSMATHARSEIALKWNALYTLVAAMNPAVEFSISPHSTFQAEIFYSPWKSINGYKFHMGYLMCEYRWHLRPNFGGFYAGANVGMDAFCLSKPEIKHGRIRFEDRYSKGTGIMLGLCVGYEKVFRERWIMDAFIGWAYMSSYYNGYNRQTNEIDMHPHGHEYDNPPDPWNGSIEWYPNKIGVSLGYIFNKKKTN